MISHADRPKRIAPLRNGIAVIAALALMTFATLSGYRSSAHATATPYTFRSTVLGASFVRLAQLPSVTPYGDNTDPYCGDPVHAKTPGGRLAEHNGWRVVQELRYHNLDTVLIVRGYDPETSSHCHANDPNVAFFDADHLVAVLYPKGKDAIRINAAEPVGDHLRIWDDQGTVGQINVNGPDFTFDQITGSDTVCGGRNQVPTVFHLPYSQARKILSRSGWIPQRSTEETSGDVRTGSYRKRFPETDSCAGTGYAYCLFALHAQTGPAKLSITTAGEDDDPFVTSYHVGCGALRSH